VTAHAAVPDLADADRLAIVQQQIAQLLIEAYQLEAAVAALPIDDPQLKEYAGKLKRSTAILTGYRTQESALLAQLTAAAAD